MARTINLIPGRRYYAGVDLPFFVPRSVVTSGAQDLGFQNIVWHDKSDPLPINPRSDPLYKDGWDEWATGIYQGPAKQETLSQSPNWIAIDPGPPTLAAAPVTSVPRSPVAQAVDIARVAMSTQDPARIKATAAVLAQNGYPSLADAMNRYAAELSGTRPAQIPQPSSGGFPWLFAGGAVAVLGFVLLLRSKKHGHRRNTNPNPK